jgi:Undecaprenyl-phosphate galactose phosphotransferase WbaP
MHVTELQTVESRPQSRAADNEWRKPRRAHAIEPSGDGPDFIRALLAAAPLAAGDILATLASFGVAWLVTHGLWPDATMDVAALGAGFVIAVCLANLGVGLYPGWGLGPVGEIRLVGLAVALVAAVFMTVSLLDSRLNVPLQLTIAATCALLLTGLPLGRAVTRTLFGRFAWWGQPVLVVGECANAAMVHSLLESNPRLALRPLGIVGDWREEDHGSPPPRLLAPLIQLRAVTRRLGNPWLLVVTPVGSNEAPTRLVAGLGIHGHRYTLISGPVASPAILSRARDCLELSGFRYPLGGLGFSRFAKRAIDIVLAIAAGLLLTPLLLLLAIFVRLSSPGPVFYRQERIGRRGERFAMWKFRTMTANADRVLQSYLDANPQLREEWNRDHKLQNDPRVTRIGRWMRKTSLDELPQLWNVLRGDMSLVGPRPIVAAEIDKYGARFEDLCSVPPGVTGLWQVSGRNDTTYAERIELDSYYARHWSVWLDLYILIVTVKVVLFRQGAY